MTALTTLARRNLLALAATAVAAALLSTGTAAAQSNLKPPPPPPVNVQTTIFKQKVNEESYKVKIRVTAEVPGVAKNTFETDWILVKKHVPKPFELKFNAMFRMYGTITWDGSKITASVTVEAQLGTAKAKRTVTASVAAS